ncbi:MAG: DUF2703 domain-containing protein [Parcubacteria group bacterium]|nr:DUF2703 domain-containing protein [Parcubacteria group bacterium]
MSIKSLQLLRNKDCNLWTSALEILKKILKENKIGIRLEVILIEDDEMAKKYKFFGSPQININNADIDPDSKKMTSYHESGCRIYIWKNNVYEGPPKEMIEAALNQVM